jgi:hypothetical protein
MKIMNTMKESNVRALAMLKYQADRYQSTGNGVMSQRINAQIRSILVEMNNSSAKNYRSMLVEMNNSSSKN